MHLKQFYEDKELLNEVKDYFIKFIELKTIENVFDRKDVSGLADAKDYIDGAFEQLDVEFASKPKKKDLNNAI